MIQVGSQYQLCHHRPERHWFRRPDCISPLEGIYWSRTQALSIAAYNDIQAGSPVDSSALGGAPHSNGISVVASRPLPTLRDKIYTRFAIGRIGTPVSLLREIYSSENKHATCSNSENAELVIYPHSLGARSILAKADAPRLAFPRMGIFAKRSNVDVRLGVDRDLCFSV